MSHLLQFLVALVAIPACAEIVLRLGYRLPDEREIAALHTRLPAWQHSVYWSPEFVDNMRLALITHYDNDIELPNDLASEQVNVADGMRRTVGEGDPALGTVYMFGSSTLYGYGVNDANTIPSLLQARTRRRVLNLASPGATIYQNLVRLKSTQIGARDVVIFYVGYLDMSGVYNDAQNRRNRAAPCPDDRGLRLQFALSRICRAFYPVTVTNADIEQGFQHFTRALNAARDWTTQHGATFYSVLEPIGRVDIRPDETNEACDTYLENFPGSDEVIRRAAIVWRNGKYDLDLSTINASRTEPVYIDCAHSNEVGTLNAAVAIAAFLKSVDGQ